MRTAVSCSIPIDPHFSARIVRSRALVYTTPPELDRPPHVRAASGLACDGERIYVIQDDASYIAVIDGDDVSAIPLPAADGVRRFEAANKHDKLDLESCFVAAGELWAFGSGSTPKRERILRHSDAPRLTHAPQFYAALRAALGGRLNVEGATLVGDELWLFHRGNTGPGDRPAIVRAAFDLDTPRILGVEVHDLGAIGGQTLGFTDATTYGSHILYLAAAEASANAIDDGPTAGSQLGIVGGGAAPLVGPDGAPIKAEGIAVRGDRILVTVDPDDPDVPAMLHEVELS